MGFFDDLQQNFSSALQNVGKFIQQNPTPASFVLNQLPQKLTPRTPMGSMGTNAYNLGMGVARGVADLPSTIERAYTPVSQNMGYYIRPYPWVKSPAEKATQFNEENSATLQKQQEMARNILINHPATRNAPALRQMINDPSAMTYEQLTPQEFQRTPGQMVGQFGSLALDVATAGSMPKTFKPVLASIPKLAKFLGGGAALGASYGLTESLSEKLTPQETAKTVGLYAAGGAAVGLGLFGASALANRLITRKRIFNAMENAAAPVGKSAQELMDASQKTYFPEIGRRSLDDAALQLQDLYQGSADDALEGLAKIDTSKVKGWDDLTRKAMAVTDDSKMQKDILAHVMTRRIWSSDPDALAFLVQKYDLDIGDDAAKQSVGTIKQKLEQIFTPVDEVVRSMTPEQIPQAVQSTADGAAAQVGKIAASSEVPSKLANKVAETGFHYEGFWNKPVDDLIKHVVDASGYEKKTITWSETQAMAQELGLNPAVLSRKKAERLNGQEMLAIRDVINSNADFIVNGEKRLATEVLTEEEKQELNRKMGIATTQSQELMEKFLEARSQSGRDLNSLKIIANRSLDPTSWLAITQKALGNKPLTNEVRSSIMGLIQAKDRVGLVEYISKLRRSSVGDKAAGLWKAGLLTAFRTHEANLIGNIGMSAMESVKDVPATMIDWALGQVTGERTKAMGISKLQASKDGTVGGLKKAWRYVRSGIDTEQMLQKYDIPKQVNFDHKVVQLYYDAVFRSLGGSDKVFRERAVKRSLMEDALVEARRMLKTKEIKPQDYRATVQQLYTSPTDEMAKRAIDNAENAADYATFQQDNKLASAVNAAKAKGGLTRFLLEVTAPFVKTPANIAKTVSDYSPMGLFTTILDQVKKGYNQKQLAEGLGRAITGTGVIALGSFLASKGLMRGTPSPTASERNVSTTARQMDMSIKIGDKWYQINRISPLGNLLVLGADVYDVSQQAQSDEIKPDQKLGNIVGGSAFSYMRQMTQQPTVQGVSRGLNAINDPDRYGASFIENAVAGVVPNILGDVARGLDPRLLQPEGIVESIKAGIPGMTDDIGARTDMFGQERKFTQEEGTGKRLFQALFNPIASSKEVDNPVVSELVRMKATSPIPSKKKLTFPNVDGEIKLSPERQRDYTRVAGAYYYNFLKGLMSTPAWDVLNDEQKQEAVDSAYREAGKAGTAYLQYEYIQHRMQKSQQGLNGSDGAAVQQNRP